MCAESMLPNQSDQTILPGVWYWFLLLWFCIRKINTVEFPLGTFAFLLFVCVPFTKGFGWYWREAYVTLLAENERKFRRQTLFFDSNLAWFFSILNNNRIMVSTLFEVTHWDFKKWMYVFKSEYTHTH